jgi:carbamoyltransferase
MAPERGGTRFGEAILVYILGLSCYYHDAAACLLRNGRIVAAAQEERFTRVKHDWHFPENAIRYCLAEAGIGVVDLELIVFYEKPFVRFERVLETFLAVAPRGMRAFIDTVPSWLRQKLWLRHTVEKELGFTGKLLFAEHHQSHAASSFFLSPFEEAALLTVDGVGEWATASYGIGRGNRVTLSHEMRFPHSLGLLYSTFTAYLGFEVNDAEYKVMGMAPYGKPVYQDLITKEVVEINADGSIRLNLDCFAFQYGRRMYSRRLEKLFGMPARTPESEIAQKHLDIAASLQKVTEEVILAMARHVHAETGMRNLCLAGGVALNSVANGRLLREGPFEGLFIQPAAGDAGAALGAACLGWHHHLGRSEREALTDVFLGPAFSDEEIGAYLAEVTPSAPVAVRKPCVADLCGEVARLLADGKVIGWFQGRMEFGPRALGNRSILADPRRAEMKAIVNEKIKFREGFRPFAPAVTLEDAETFFDMQGDSPYMLLTVPARSEQIPAATHVDGSARVQTVKREDNPLFHALLREFESISGVPVLMNTSLNLRGEPIVCTPADAFGTFMRCGMDGLVLGNFLVLKDWLEVR